MALKPRPHQAQQPGSAPLAGGASASSSSSGGSSSSSGSGSLSLEELRGWARERLPPYQLPETLQVVEAIPRNAMGKVNKKRLREQLFPDRLPAAKAA